MQGSGDTVDGGDDRSRTGGCSGGVVLEYCEQQLTNNLQYQHTPSGDNHNEKVGAVYLDKRHTFYNQCTF